MSFSQLQADAVSILAAWPAPDEALAAERDRYLSLLSTHHGAMSRDGGPDHFTCGGLVFDPPLVQVALVLHGKAKLWLQPGGHFEAADSSLAAAVAREVVEETGLPVDADRAELVDLHHHQLSAAFGRCRSHLDLRFAFVLDAPAPIVVSSESDAAQWWPVDALPEPTDPDLAGIVRRVRDQLRPGRPSESAGARSRS
ncbi:NUDIX domain-containing protein [Yimella sp. cx-573]|nr:NUDIX domain-containing protein [Yimella sp. cx-573]